MDRSNTGNNEGECPSQFVMDHVTMEQNILANSIQHTSFYNGYLNNQLKVSNIRVQGNGCIRIASQVTLSVLAPVESIASLAE